MSDVLIVKHQDRVGSWVFTFDASVGDSRRGARRVTKGVRGEILAGRKQPAIDLPFVVSQPADFNIDYVTGLILVSARVLLCPGNSRVASSIRQLGQNRTTFVERRIDDP